MAEQTGIEWCDATFNPWWGCDRVSPACAHCYADSLAIRYGHRIWGADHDFRFFGDKHWAEPLKWARLLPAKLGRRPRVFCASMADVFENRPELGQARERLFALIAATPEIDWLVLTKRPEVARAVLGHPMFWLGVNGQLLEMCHPVIPGGMSDFAAGRQWLPNLWMGVSIENARFTWRADVLREIPAAVRFISAEPLLGSLYPETFECPRCEGQRYDVGSCFLCANRGRLDDRGSRDRMPLDLTGIDWVIVGGESGAGARPFHLEHAREIVAAARTMRQEARVEVGGVPGELLYHSAPSIFVKQLGARPVVYRVELETGSRCTYDADLDRIALNLVDRKGGDWSEWPADLRIREFPRSAA